MTREDLKGIIEGITDEQLKAILDINTSDIGKAKGDLEHIKNELSTAKGTITDYEGKIKDFETNAADADKLNRKITDLQKQIDDRKAADQQARQEAALAERFQTVSEKAEFLNAFTWNGIFEEFKTAVSDESNAGKSDGEIYAQIIKDRDGIFKSKNPPIDVPGVSTGAAGAPEITREQFQKMGYIARNKLFTENRDLYDKLNNE